jgi:N-acetylneuraminate synthase|tara:strand:+ start:286 stop:1296 length:1011 start_codon:yes stop_codon:yes gene_type:complete
MNKKYPFIIAEMSGNHNQSLDNALELVDAAADSGADAIKIQTYTADTIAIKGVHKIEDPGSLWYGRDLHDLYDEAHTPWEWHSAIFERAKKNKIICFSSPFDETAVDLLESLGNPIYKIASFEINHIPLLRKVAKTKKPVIMSIGASSLSEIEEAVNTLRSEGCGELILLKCTSAYPALHSDANLVTIPHLKNLFNCEVGLSDHTKGIAAPIVAVGLGAKYIEKHFCLDRSKKGVDSEFSLEPDEFKMLTREVRNAYKTIGVINYGLIDSEKKGDAGKRSIYVSDFIKSGEKITEKNIKIVRPGYGMHPRYFDKVIGKIVLSDLHPGDKLSFNKLK